MAEVLLTHSYHLPYDRKQARKMEPYPPLGTLYAAGLLRANGRPVAVFDTMLQEPQAGFRDALKQHRPRIVAIYEDDFNFLTKMCLTRMREVAWQMIETAREWGAQVVVHGSDATDRAGEYLRHGCDYVLEGEAEYTLLHVVNAMVGGGDARSIPGVKWLKRGVTGETVEASPRRATHASAKLPLPARDLIDVSLYRTSWKSAQRAFSMNLIASRGCPFRCNWCAKPIFGDAYQLRPAAEVAQEMKLLKETHGAEHLWFADDIFGLNRHWVKEFALCVEEQHCAVPFKIQARADLMTKEIAQALRRAGCAEVWMGAESGSQKVLDAMEKGLRVEEVIAAREHLKREGIRACYFLQLGYPGEQWEDIQKTIALVRETRPDDVGVSFSYPLPNTRFYERVKKQLGAKQNWSDSEDLCVMFKGAYTDRLYRAVRDALHAEVESWKSGANEKVRPELWQDVAALEPICRNADATELPDTPAECDFRLVADAPFVLLRTQAEAAGGASD
ncbi:MAG: B12-binding domain-containing radical SAM protein [Candidatus Acidiferrales bacterium]